MSAASLVIGGVLLATACGGGESSGKNDKIAGAQSASPSEGASQGSDKEPGLKLPDDFEVDYQWDKPGESKSAQAVANAEKYVTSIWHGVAKQNVDDPAHDHYSTGQAKSYARWVIKSNVDGGYTSTGKDRYYDLGTEAKPGRDMVAVTFCEDQSKVFSKEVKSGKTIRSKPNLKSYVEWSVLMERSPATGKRWKAKTADVTGESKECQSKA
ncbi:hypothetical protein [Streptomyces sp. ODS28]|uniref:hypothetical protein n=1 Tax=Streptomyces sp. ODS28 TaxID=3136688 RepID=UPI0031F121C1